MRIYSGESIRNGIEKTKSQYLIADFRSSVAGELLAGLMCLVAVGLVIAIAVLVV